MGLFDDCYLRHPTKEEALIEELEELGAIADCDDCGRPFEIQALIITAGGKKYCTTCITNLEPVEGEEV